jgi:hypothetical protein
VPSAEHRLRIDIDQCRALGEIALRLPNRPEYFMPRAPAGTTAVTEALFWIVSSAICQQTRTLRGVIGGRALRGSDYLIAALRQHLARHPEMWTAKALPTWTVEELRRAVSDEGDPTTSTLDREEERLALLRGVAEVLDTGYGGSAMELFESSDRRVATLLGRLAAIPAYADPVQKKSHLLLIFLHERGLWPLADPESLEIAIDYHIMRVALRSGIVEVEDDALRRQLVDEVPADEATDTAVRTTVRNACRRVLRETAGLTPFRLDNLLWMVGRNCCFYEHPPVCTRPKACWKRAACSLLEAFPHDCGLSCPLSPVCRGARDEAHRSLRETKFDTHFY